MCVSDPREHSAQVEASESYGLLRTLCEKEPLWIVGGDLNEVVSELDRKTEANYAIKRYKFVSTFLEDTHGKDVWRELYPQLPGFTFTTSPKYYSRLDYFLASPLIDMARSAMSISNWLPHTDHAKITFRTIFLGKDPSYRYHQSESIVRPQLKGIPAEKIEEIRERCNSNVESLYRQIFLRASPDPDQVSMELARILVETAIQVAGKKRHNKKRDNRTRKLRAEIRAIHRARDLIREIAQQEGNTQENWNFLGVLLDRLARMNLASVPSSMDIETLQTWAEEAAVADLGHLPNLSKKGSRTFSRINESD